MPEGRKPPNKKTNEPWVNSHYPPDKHICNNAYDGRRVKSAYYHNVSQVLSLFKLYKNGCCDVQGTVAASDVNNARLF